MPSLRDEAHDGVLCTFSTRTSATAAGFATTKQLQIFCEIFAAHCETSIFSREICGYGVCVCGGGGGG
jgi:hypothetical protein